MSIALIGIAVLVIIIIVVVAWVMNDPKKNK